MKIPLPECVKTLSEELGSQDYCAYLVGGALRDLLSGKEAQDFDLATDAEPKEMRRVFSHRRILDHGEKHGTLTVFYENTPVEITTFRTESAYSDARHPDAVVFTRDLSEDLSRRDFTVNAMAYSEKTGLVDPYHGKEDLQNKRLRCAGDPAARFAEDRLRVLRALRFCATEGFVLEEESKRAVLDFADRLTDISRERVFSELSKLLCGGGICRVMLEFPAVFCALIPELAESFGFDQHSPYHCFDVYTHTAYSVGEIKPELSLRFAALFHDIAKPMCFKPDETGRGHFPNHAERGAEICARVLSDLRAPRALTEKVKRLVRDHDEKFVPDLTQAKYALMRFGKEYLYDLLELERADAYAHEKTRAYTRRVRLAAFTACVEEVLSSGACYSLEQLQIDGNDIKALGVLPDRTGELLRTALCAVIEGKTANEAEAILQYLNCHLKNDRQV